MSYSGEIMGLDYTEIIHSVKDWFGVIALIITVLGVSFYKITKNLSAKYQFIALMFLITTMMPVVYIKLFSEIKIPATTTASGTQKSTDSAPAASENKPVPAKDIIIGCGRVHNLRPASGDGFLVVRSGPNKNDDKIDEIFNNEAVNILKKEDNRLHIIYRENLRGWVHKKWIKDTPC